MEIAGRKRIPSNLCRPGIRRRGDVKQVMTNTKLVTWTNLCLAAVADRNAVKDDRRRTAGIQDEVSAQPMRDSCVVARNVALRVGQLEDIVFCSADAAARFSKFNALWRFGRPTVCCDDFDENGHLEHPQDAEG